MKAILNSGGTGYWVPASVVHHCVPPEHQTVSRIFRYFKAHGETSAFIEGSCTSKIWFSVPRWLWVKMARNLLLYYCGRAASKPEFWVKYLTKYAYDRGMADYWRKVPILQLQYQNISYKNRPNRILQPLKLFKKLAF